MQERLVENRRLGRAMQRRWLQAVFVHRGSAGRAVEQWQGQVQHEQQQQQSGAAPEQWAAASEGEERKDVRLDGMMLQLWLPREGTALLAPSLDASLALARLLLAIPSLLCSACVVELGCGAAALPSLAALRHCRLAVATDGAAAMLGLLRRNAASNGYKFVIERLRLQRLDLSKSEDAERQQQLATLRSACPGQFDVVVSAARADPELLVSTAATLLGRRQGAVALLLTAGGSDAAGRRSLADVAQRLRLAEVAWPEELAEAAASAGIQRPGLGGLELAVLGWEGL